MAWSNDAWEQAVEHARAMANEFARVLGTCGRKVEGQVGQAAYAWVWGGTIDGHACQVKFVTSRHEKSTYFTATGNYSVVIDVGYKVRQATFNYKKTSKVNYDKLVARVLENRDYARRIIEAEQRKRDLGLETAKRVGRLEEEYRTDKLPIVPRLSGGDDGKFSIAFRGLTEAEARTILDLVSQVPRRRTA